MTRTTSRRRRWVRVALWVLGGLLGLLALAVIGAILFLKSEAGGRWVRDQAVKAAEEALVADVEIEAAELSLSGDLTLRGVDIRKEGERRVFIGELAADPDLGAILGGDMRITSLTLREPYVDVDRITDILSDEEGSPVTIESLTIRDGRIRVGGQRISGIDLDARIRTGPTLEIEAQLLKARAKLGDLDAELSREMKASLHERGGEGLRLELFGGELRAGASRLSPTRVAIGLEEGDFAGSTALVLEPSDVRALARAFSQPLDEERRLEGTLRGVLVAGRTRGGPVSAFFTGALGDATTTLAAELATDGSRAKVALSTRDFEPHRIWRGLPEGKLSLQLRARSSGLTLEALEGKAELDVRGAIAGLTVRDLSVSGGADRGRFWLTADLEGEPGDGSLAARASLKEGTLVLEESHVEARDLALSDLGELPVSGRVKKVRVDAAGALDAVRTGVRVELTGMRYDRARAASLRAEAHATVDVPALLEGALPRTGRASVQGRGLSHAGRPIGDLSAKGRVYELGRRLELSFRHRGPNKQRASGGLRIALDPERGRVRIGVRTLDLHARGLALRGEGGTVALDRRGRIAVEGLSLQGDSGKVTVSGVLPPEGARSREGERLEIELENIDLARIMRALPEAPPLAGEASAAVSIGRAGRFLTVAGETRVSGLKSGDLPPVSARLSFEVGGGRAEIEASGSLDGEPPRFEIQGRLAAPPSPFDAEGWARTDLDRVQKARIQITDVDLARLAHLVGTETPVRGVVRASVDVPEQGAPAKIEVELSDGAAGGIEEIGAVLRGSFKEAFRGELEVELGGERVATADLAWQIPLERALRARPRDLQRAGFRAKVTVDGFDLARVHRAGLVDEELAGALSGTIRAEGTPSQWKARLEGGEVRNLELRGARVAHASLSGELTPDSVEATVATNQPGGGRLRLELGYGWGETPRVKLALLARRFDLRVLRALATDDVHPLAEAEGLLEATLKLDGTPEALAASGYARLAGGTLLLESGNRPIRNIELVARLKEDRLIIDRLAGETDAGRVEAKGRVRLDEMLPRDFSFTVSGDNLQVLAGPYRAEIDLRAKLSGRYTGERIEATAALQGGRVHMRAADRELQSFGELEDVVFVDRQAKREAAREAAQEDGTPWLPEILLNIRTDDPIAFKATLNVPYELRPNVKLSTDLRMRIVGGELVSTHGRIATVSGHADLFDRRYRVVVGRADFDGPIDNPTVDFQLTRDFPVAAVQLRVYGQVRDPKVELTDDLGHTETQVLQVMTGGDPDRAGENALGGAVGSYFAEKLRDVLPFDVVYFDPDGVRAGFWFDLAFAEALVLGKTRYEEVTSPDENQNEVQVELYPTRSIVFEGRYGDHSVVTGDLLWIFRF